MHSRVHAFLTHPPYSQSSRPRVQDRRFSRFFSFSPSKKIIRGPSAHLGTALETPFSPLSFGKSFMKIRSAVPENGCLVFMHYRCGGRTKATKNKKKQTVKHIRIRAT